MERQSEQELLAIVPVETESLEGNRIYQVTGREGKELRKLSTPLLVKKENMSHCPGVLPGLLFLLRSKSVE